MWVRRSAAPAIDGVRAADDPAENAESSASTCLAEGRPRADLSSIRISSRSSTGGRSGTQRSGVVAADDVIEWSIASVDSASNGCLPVASSYSTTANEKTSLAALAVSPRACSGDM